MSDYVAKVHCKDIYDTVDGISNTNKTVSTYWSQFKQGSDLCGKGVDDYTGSCNLLSYVSALDDSEKSEALNVCKTALGDCKPTFCSDGATEADVGVKCDQLKSWMQIIMADKNLMGIINGSLSKYNIQINSLDDICSTLQVLNETPSELTQNLKKAISDGLQGTGYEKFLDLIDSYADELPDILNCICPGLGPPSKYNRSTILILAGIVGVVALIAIVVVFVMMRKKPLFLSFGWAVVIMALCGAFVGIMIATNPKCLFRACGSAGDDWKAVTSATKYTGSYSLLGISITLTGTLQPDNTFTFSELSCKGGACPTSDLLSGCSSKSVTIDVSDKTSLGYPMVGECVQSITSYTTGDGRPDLKGIWIEIEGDKKYANVGLHVCTSKNVCPLENGVVRIPLSVLS